MLGKEAEMLIHYRSHNGSEHLTFFIWISARHHILPLTFETVPWGATLESATDMLLT
jgi:hypothetical protein